MFTPFYNESIRKLIVAFGSLFNNIRISTTNSQGETDHIKVPLSYGPKEKFLRRIEESSGISDHTKVQITLPRLGFNITDMTYDSTRKRNTIQRRYYHPKGYTYDGGHRAFEYSEVPYNFNISMYGFTRTMTDALQITEQVLPYFTPDFIVTVKFDENAHSKVDIPFVLNNVTIEEEYEGDFQDRRNITTQYDFSAKSYIYGPRKNSKVILFTENTFYSYFGTTTDFENVEVATLIPRGFKFQVTTSETGATNGGPDGRVFFRLNVNNRLRFTQTDVNGVDVATTVKVDTGNFIHATNAARTKYKVFRITGEGTHSVAGTPPQISTYNALDFDIVKNIGDDFTNGETVYIFTNRSGNPEGITGAISRVDVGVSGASTDGGTGYSAGNYITFDNRYVIGGPLGSSADRDFIDRFGNTYAGASYNPPNF